MNRHAVKLLILALAVFACAGWAATSSTNVVIIGGAAIYNGGFLPTTVPGVAFSSIGANAVTDASLAGFDTVVLNVASGGGTGFGLYCNVVTNLPAAGKAALVNFVHAGKKLIIYDSECSPQDYTWLPFPFTTNNPGPTGTVGGALTIAEENTLSSSNPASPYFIDTTFLTSSTDAVGDMNVMVTRDPAWCVDLSGTNANQVTGAVRTYARVISGNNEGLIIYNGLDTDLMGVGTNSLVKVYTLEIQQPFNPSGLPCQMPVVPRFQVAYAANLNVGESYINISNTGANGAPLLGPGFGGAVGNICANVYAFSPDEQLISCCSCLLTPNSLANLAVTRDLTAKTLTGTVPTSVIVKVIPSLAGPGGTGTTCNNSAATIKKADIRTGLVAWRTTLHATPQVSTYATTETEFSTTLLSDGELASLTGRCASILANGSGFGVCRSCQSGALGGTHM